MKNVLITGASGFLGRNLLELLSQNSDFQLTASTDSPQKISGISKCESIRIVPRNHFDSADFADESYDYVVNCAYPRNSSGFETADGLQYLENIFFHMKVCSVGHVINISSQSVYDPNRCEPADETALLCLTTPYSIGKYSAERMLDIICSDIPHTHLRMASLIGEGFNQRIVNRFVDKALRMEPLTVDDSLQKFGFLDVRDAAEAIRCILTMDAANWKPVYNVGSDSGYTLIEIIQAVKEVFTQEHLSFPDILTVESDNTGSTELDTCLLKTDSGFQTMYSLKESILWILRWYQNHSA